MAKNIDIGGRLHSTATGNIVTGANEVYDDDKNKKQSEINTETYTLVNEVNAKLDGLSPEQQGALDVATKANKNEANLGYYVCGTEENVAAKVISDATGYILSKGGSIKVKMTNANSANNATLNINSAGAKALYYDGERASANNSWKANETVEVYYDGTSYYANNVAGGFGDGVFDVSVKYPTSGVEGGNTYTLDGALAVLNANLPTSKKKGGMSIKFVQSSDNKYIQARCMAQNFTADITKWQGVDDEPTAGSKNLVESGGVQAAIEDIKGDVETLEGITHSIGKYLGEEPVEYINLINKAGDKKGTMNSQGVITIDESANSYVSDFIDVSSVESVKFGYWTGTAFSQININLCKYDSELQLIGVRQTANQADVSDCNYIRIVMPIASEPTFIVTDSNSTVSSYIPYNVTKEYGKNVDFKIREVEEKVDEQGEDITEIQTVLQILVYPINRFNKNDAEIVDNATFNSQGVITSSESTTSFVSGFCNVSDMNNFCIYKSAGLLVSTYYCLYDEEKNLIGGRRVSSATELTSTEGAAYIRFVINMSYKDSAMVADSMDLESYEAYFAPYRSNDSQRLKDIEDRIEDLEPINEVTVGTGGDYTSILRALKETDANIPVHILNGTYDIEQEYKDYYGNSFWDDYVNYNDPSVKDDNFYKGLWLAKGRRVYGDSDVNIVFNYSGSNSQVFTYFSIFANDVNTLLEGVKIHVNNNVRYSIHDDFKPYDGEVRWKNIIFYGKPHSAAHIGAGLGFRVTYYLEGLVFLDNHATGHYDISYHGCATNNPTTSACKIYVRDCFGTAICGFRWYGPHTVVCPCIVSNSTFGKIVCETKEDNPTPEIVNMELIKYNCLETGYN